MIIQQITETAQRRRDFHQEEKALTLRIRAIMRRMVQDDDADNATIKKDADKLYDAVTKGKDHELRDFAAAYIGPLFDARDVLEARRKDCEKEMVGLAKQLPAYSWIEQQKGVGALGFALILGEAGDLANYANPAKLWKRMGLAVMPDGRQRKHSNKELALEHGYAPNRRSLVWTIGDSMLRTNGYYRGVYDDRKQYEVEKAESEGLEVRPAAEVEKLSKKGYDPAKFRTVGHVHNRAKRYAEKRLLRDLWRVW